MLKVCFLCIIKLLWLIKSIYISLLTKVLHSKCALKLQYAQFMQFGKRTIQCDLSPVTNKLLITHLLFLPNFTIIDRSIGLPPTPRWFNSFIQSLTVLELTSTRLIQTVPLRLFCSWVLIFWLDMWVILGSGQSSVDSSVYIFIIYSQICDFCYKKENKKRPVLAHLKKLALQCEAHDRFRMLALKLRCLMLCLFQPLQPPPLGLILSKEG